MRYVVKTSTVLSLQMSRTGAWQELLDPNVFERLRQKDSVTYISLKLI